MSAEAARSPRFWADQITDTVHFRNALDELLAADDVLLIEAGPRQTLTAFARRHRSVRLGSRRGLPAPPGPRGHSRGRPAVRAQRRRPHLDRGP